MVFDGDPPTGDFHPISLCPCRAYQENSLGLKWPWLKNAKAISTGNLSVTFHTMDKSEVAYKRIMSYRRKNSLSAAILSIILFVGYYHFFVEEFSYNDHPLLYVIAGISAFIGLFLLVTCQVKQMTICDLQ